MRVVALGDISAQRTPRCPPVEPSLGSSPHSFQSLVLSGGSNGVTAINHLTISPKGLFGFQRGVTVGSRSQLGRPA